MRLIFPAQADGTARGPFGPADPLRLAGRISQAEADALGVDDLVASLAAIYACPDGRWVRGNMIASVDGAVALDGRSGGLSGVADRVVFWVLRSLADVVLVGAGTVREEQYGQIRPGDMWQALRTGRPATPPIAVVTRRLDLALDGRLFGGRPEAAAGRPGDDGSKTIVLTTELVPEHRLKAAARVAEVVVVGEQTVTAAAAVEALAVRGYRSILAEGGPRLLGELTAAGLLDELCLTISPVLEGGHSAARLLSAPPGAGPELAPTTLRLASLLEDDGFLFSRYLRAG